MSVTFFIKQHDRRPLLTVSCLDNAGMPVSLESASQVKFYMKSGESLKVSASATPDPDQDLNPGVVTYAWALGDTDTAGRYKAEFEVTWSDGTPQTFPTSDYLVVIIKADLGP